MSNLAYSAGACVEQLHLFLLHTVCLIHQIKGQMYIKRFDTWMKYANMQSAKTVLFEVKENFHFLGWKWIHHQDRAEARDDEHGGEDVRGGVQHLGGGRSSPETLYKHLISFL